MIDDDRKIERLVQVAEMYYRQDLNQSQIAAALHVSRPLVSLLLNEARQRGIVTVTINHAENAKQLLAEQLAERFRLQDVVIIDDQKNAEATDDLLAQKAFDYCFGSCRGMSIGIGWGSIIGRMADYAEKTDRKEEIRGSIFPLIGGIGASYRGYHPNEITRILSMHTGLKADYLYLPAFFDSEDDLNYARRMETCLEFVKNWQAMDLALVTISNSSSYPDLGVEYRFGGEFGKERAAGRILAYYYTQDGALLVPKIDNVMQVPMKNLQAAKKVVATCSALLQSSSATGALAMHFIDVLILPESLARRLSGG